jgi:hypothetical protein
MFEKFYSSVGVVPASEFELFMSTLRNALPATLRINQLNNDIAEHLRNELRTTWYTRIAGAALDAAEMENAHKHAADTTADTINEVKSDEEEEGILPADDLLQIVAPFPLPWYPNDMAWQVTTCRRTLRKVPALKQFH